MADKFPMRRREVFTAGGSAAVLANVPGYAKSLAPAAPLEDAVWLGSASVDDSFALFRATFALSEPTEIAVNAVASDSYILWLDGEWLGEGPLRYEPSRVEFAPVTRRLNAGTHVLAAQIRRTGVENRYLYLLEPYFWCRATAGGSSLLRLRWRAQELIGQKSGLRRVSPQLGWVEWRDTKQEPVGWRLPHFDDRKWSFAKPVRPKLPHPVAATIHSPRAFDILPRKMAEGPAVETFGYETDDPAMRFFVRDLAPADLPPTGVWARFDLGRVRLGRTQVTIDAPAGTAVEIAMAEALTSGRVNPVISLSLGESCNLDHFVVEGGTQTVMPHDPRGGRYVEVHVLAPPEQVRSFKVGFLERGYHDATVGSFQCGDPLLERIWTTGVDTYRACTEDAVTDNPTRERGQWLGDAGVALEISTSAFGDPALVRRLLVQAARSAREDGMVAGLSPTQQRVYIPSFACLWTVSCHRLHQLTGNRAPLEELYPAAQRNIAAFRKQLGPNGIREGLGWSFIDWGYHQPAGDADPAVTLFHLASLRAMAGWAQALRRTAEATSYQREAAVVERIMRRRLAGEEAKYHVTVLGLLLGLIDEPQIQSAIDRVKAHMLSCFPNDKSAPRLSDPSVSSTRLITPYFAHYAMRALLEAGEGAFVHDQYRRCWGWWLKQGKTTWMEVFDPRWSHCHQWSGSPTWQLTRYGLGLHPRFEVAPLVFDFKMVPGELRKAAGEVPIGNGQEPIAVSWERDQEGIEYRLNSPVDIQIRGADGVGRPILGRSTAVLRLAERNGVWTLA